MAEKSEGSSGNITAIFSEFQEHLNSEQEKREEIRDSVKLLEQTARELFSIAQKSHQLATEDGVKEMCQQMKEKIGTCRSQIQNIGSKIPIGQYYRYNDHWRNTMQRISFLASFVIYLEKEVLASREEIAETLGVKLKWQDGFQLDLDDYLIGLLLLANELSRLAINSVTLGNYKRPIKIGRFLSELDIAFRLLNLKNDALRKKFDGLKYDLKKVEEVVYDLSIRGLSCKTDEQQ